MFFFDKDERLKKKKDFNTVFEIGKEIILRNYKIIYKYNNLDRSRLGIIATKKIGHSVKRNFEKRVVRESFRLHKYLIKKTIDVVVIPFKTNVSPKLRRKEIDSFFLNIQSNVNEQNNN